MCCVQSHVLPLFVLNAMANGTAKGEAKGEANRDELQPT